MADSSLADYIKANKIKPNRRPGAAQVTNKGPKKNVVQKAKKGNQQQGAGKKFKKVQQAGAKKVNKVQQGGVKKVKNVQRGGFKPMRGQATRGRGQVRSNWRPKAAANIARTYQSFKPVTPFQSFKPVAPVKTAPAKVTITNLDFGVSEQDIKELFSEFGTLKKTAIHYNAQGKSMGVADLVYARHADALKAIRQYNGVALDGRQMKLKLEGQQAAGGLSKPNIVKRLTRGAAPMVKGRGGQRGTFKVRGGQRGTFKVRGGQRGTFKVRGGQRGTFKARGGARGQGAVRGQKPTRGQGATRGRGGARSGRGGRGGKRANQKPPTVEELDAQLDAYIKTKA